MEERKIDRGSVGVHLDSRRDEACVYLLGSPPVRDYLQFCRLRAVPGTCADEITLVEEWRTAADRVLQLELLESGIADRVELRPLAPDGEVQELLGDPTVRASLGILPYRWALVNTDQLIVHQRSVDLGFVARLREVFPEVPNDRDLFRLSAGRLLQAPEVRVSRTSDNVYTFSSPSSDLRFLDLALLDARDVHRSGPWRAAYAITAFVGFGVNFMIALRMQERLILINGTNRAYMAYERGVRFLPCLIREVSRPDELDLIGAADVNQHLQVYLNGSRPPLLKDYFDARLRKIIPVAHSIRMVHVQVNTQRATVSTG